MVTVAIIARWSWPRGCVVWLFLVLLASATGFIEQPGDIDYIRLERMPNPGPGVPLTESATCVQLDNEFVVLGGGVRPGGSSPPRFNTHSYKVRYFGSNEWIKSPEETPFKDREGMMAAVLNNFIYVCGGKSILSDTMFSDCYRSADGLTWTQILKNGPFGPRSFGRMVAFKGSLYIIGGLLQSKESSTSNRVPSDF